jgi:hypothetical protein
MFSWLLYLIQFRAVFCNSIKNGNGLRFSEQRSVSWLGFTEVIAAEYCHIGWAITSDMCVLVG